MKKIFVIDVTIHTRRDIRCLPYAGFFWKASEAIALGHAKPTFQEEDEEDEVDEEEEKEEEERQ